MSVIPHQSISLMLNAQSVGKQASSGESTKPAKSIGTPSEEEEATVSICPVCSFSAPTPRKLDEHMEMLHEERAPQPQPPSLTSQTPSEADPDQYSRQCSTPKPLQASTGPDPVDLSSAPVISPSDQCRGTPQLQLILPSEDDDDGGGGSGGGDADVEASVPAPTARSACSSESAFSSSCGGGGEASPRTTTMSTRDMRSQDSFLDEEHSAQYEAGLPILHRNSLQADSRRRYRCNLCPATFPWHGDLTEHLRFEHGVQKSRENSRGGKAGNFCCSCCKYVAKYQSELRRHMRLHWGVKPFACVFCPYRSAWKGDLKRHMESHHKECFSSEAELVKIMSQFKNNAGTAAVDPDAVAGAGAPAPSAGQTTAGNRRTSSGPATDASEEMAADQQTVNTQEGVNYLPECDNALAATRILLDVKKENYPQTISFHDYRGREASHQHYQLPGTYEELAPQPMSVDPCATSLPLNTAAVTTDSLFPGFRSWASPLAGFSLSHEQLVSKPESAGSPQQQTQASKPCPLLSTNTSQFLSAGLPSALIGGAVLNSYPAFNLPMVSALTNETAVSSAPELLTKSEDPQTQPLNLACPKRDPDMEPAVGGLLPPPLFASQHTAIKEFMAQFEQQFLLNQLMGSLTAAGDVAGSSEVRTPSQASSPALPPVLAPATSQSLSKFNVSSTLFCWPEQSEGQPAKRRTLLKGSPSTPSSMPCSSSSSVREEQWKRYQCSGCGHRSNWKWDINKHIKVAHPERTNISTITMDLEEARLTLPAYLDKIKGLRNRNCRFASCRGGTGNETDQSDNQEECASTSEGYYRPFKCSVCGHRSNWKWDVKKHIKQMHDGAAEVITLSLEEARRTIHHYKTHRRQSQLRHSFGGGGGGGSSLETKFPVSPLQCEFRETADRSETRQWTLPLLLPKAVEDRLSSQGTYEPEEGALPAEVTDKEPTTAIEDAAAAQTQTSPGFRCSTCRRRLPTWSSLHLHTVFNHGNNKRSYKKVLLHKALSSPSAAQLSPSTTPTKPKTSPESSATAFPLFQPTQPIPTDRLEKASQPEPIMEEANPLQRRKAHARRSLVLPIVGRPSQLTPLRSSALDNCKEEVILRPPQPPQPLQSNLDSEPHSADKAFELVSLLERVLQLLEGAGATSNLSLADLQSSCNQSLLTSLKELARERATQAAYSVDKEGNLSGSECQNTSNEENSTAACETIQMGGPSERLVELLLQPQVQPLMKKLSILLQKAQHLGTTTPSTGI